MIDRSIFFNKVRSNPFGGAMSQTQVDGMAETTKAEGNER